MVYGKLHKNSSGLLSIYFVPVCMQFLTVIEYIIHCHSYSGLKLV